MKNSRSSPTTLVPTLIEIVFGTVRALVRPHTGQFISCGFTMAAACYIISDSRRGRRENTSERKAEFSGLKAEITGLKAGVAGLKAGVAGLKAEITSLKAEITGLKAGVAGLKAGITGLKAEITGFGAEIKSEISVIKADLAVIRDKAEYCQSMVVEGGHHIMKALDGNKQPIRQWLQELEDRKEGSKMDCNPTRKA